MSTSVGIRRTPRVHSIRRSVAAALILMPLLLAAESHSQPPAAPVPTALIASKLSIVSVAIATESGGFSFLDNFIPCTRRGVIDFHNTRRGRGATFSGCDLGDGVTVDGSAEVRLNRRRSSRRRGKKKPRTLKLTGDLTVTVGASGPVQVKRMTVRGIVFRNGSESDELIRKLLRVSLLGKRTRVDARGSIGRMFAPRELNANSIPNPTNSLAALTEVDVKRIAYDPAMDMMVTLVNETLEIERGEHTHRLGCGTLHVLPNEAKGTTHLDWVFRTCPPGALGLVFTDGTVTTDGTALDLKGQVFDSEPPVPVAMLVQGRITLGGGIPRITLDRLEWSISLSGKATSSPFPTPPVKARISGRMVAGTQERAFAFDVLVDN